VSANYYVWYTVERDDAHELEQAVRSMQARLACRTGVVGRLLKRREAPDTWMEVYEKVTDPGAFEPALASLVDQYDIEVRLRDRRHTECFVEPAVSMAPHCAAKEV